MITKPNTNYTALATQVERQVKKTGIYQRQTP